jgi:caa(3)-type oxidase subunit IV
METNEIAAFKRQLRGHLNMVLLLAGLVGLNVGVAFLPLGHGLKIAAHLTLAVLSAGLVLTFFMHLVSEKKMTYAVLAVTFVLLVVMMTLTWVARHDHPAMTEYHHPNPTAAPHHVP